MRPASALALVALGALCISFAPIIVKAVAVGPAAIGIYRTAFAALALGLAAAVSPRLRSQRPVARRALLWALTAGAVFAGDLFVWHRSVLISGAGLATLLGNTQVFWVAGLGALLLGERVSGRLWACAGLALAGVALLSVRGLGSGALHLRGIGFGLLTGLFYGAYILALRECQRAARPLAAVPNLAIVSASTAACLLVAAVLSGEELVLPSRRDLLLLALLGIVVHVGGWLLIGRALAHLPAPRVALVILLQPVLATLWGVLIYDEPFGPLDAAGAALTLVAIYAATRARAAASTTRASRCGGTTT